MDSTPASSRRFRFPFPARIATAMLLGGLLGGVAGPAIEPLGQLGSVLIDLIKALAAPLLLFAVLDAFLRTRVRLRSGLTMIGISAANALVAIVIGLTIANVLQPGQHLGIPVSEASRQEAEDVGRKIDFVRELTSYVPTSVIRPLLENSIITIVFLAVLGGAALRKVKEEQQAIGRDGYLVIEEFVGGTFRALEIALGWVIALVPLAVFGVVAKTIGLHGFRPLLGLANYVGVVVLGLAIHVAIVYQGWIVLVAGMSLRRFWSGARDAVVYAMGASSSLATLPVTLRCLDRMGVSPQSARLAACVGTNLNNDGILLYEAMAVLIVAQAYGVELTLGQQALAAASCLLAGVGIAAVPDAGLISLALVLATVGLPVELLPFLLSVDWLLSRCRAMTNVSSDILVAVLLDRLGGREQAEDQTELSGDQAILLAREAGGQEAIDS